MAKAQDATRTSPAAARRVRPAAGQEGLFRELIEALEALRDRALELERCSAATCAAADPKYRQSARNLLHYLALRSTDLRDLQERLAALGLSSLGRTEAHVMASLEAVLHILHRLSGVAVPAPDTAAGFREGTALLADHAEALLGPPPSGRDVRIMVTLPSAAADRYDLVRDLLAAGMDAARINCAHDDPRTWARMIAHLERAQREVGQSCRIFMDLAGPKLRTGSLEPGPQVVRWKPGRDLRGRVVAPARVWLAPPGVPPPSGAPPDASLPVAARWLDWLRPGDRIRLRDARGKKRKLVVTARLGAGWWAEARQTAYVEPGTALVLRREKHAPEGTTRVGDLPSVEVPILLRHGETLILHRAQVPGRPEVREADGRVREPARIACTAPEVFEDVRPGEPVKLDDGKIEGVIREASPEALRIEITYAKEGGSKLRADKSISFPESRLRLSGLTPKDRADLDFAARHADVVALSFVNEPEDVLALQQELAARGGRCPGILLKIETRRGFQALPHLLLAAMRTYPVGVMIARGDLAVECGWERMAEVQEEVLWLSEAAHIPVVWATQVLESLAQKGLPSRAEITDAAMSERAECVMLNKGPHVVSAIRMLDDILHRMQNHQSKKTARLRSLKVSEGFAG